jgi:hypothetical protein
MKKMTGLLNTTIIRVVFSLISVFFLGISCTKEKSAVSPPPTEDSIFTNQIPTGPTENGIKGGIELGVKFQSEVAGYVEAIRFYKTPGNTGMHTGQLYSADGTLLASQLFVNETDSGWLVMPFAAAIPIAANTTYIAAYHSSLGNYISTAYGLKTAITNTPLTALADSTDGKNGLFKYTNTPDFPDSGYLSNNYWVDIKGNYVKTY